MGIPAPPDRRPYIRPDEVLPAHEISDGKSTILVDLARGNADDLAGFRARGYFLAADVAEAMVEKLTARQMAVEAWPDSPKRDDELARVGKVLANIAAIAPIKGRAK